MENRLHQRRVSFSDQHSPNHHGSSGSRNDKARNWLRKTTFHDDYIRDDTAFAIHSLEEAELRNLQKMRERPKSSRTQPMRRKEDGIPSPRQPTYGETSMNRSFGQDPRTKESAFPVRRPSGVSSPMPVTPALGYPKQQGLPLQHKNVQTRPETCEKAMIRLIQKQYKKMKSEILSWEFVKKIQAKAKRAMEMQNCKNKIARPYMMPQGARAGLEDKRRKESEARKKTNKNAKTSKVHVKCLCFNS